MVGAISLGWSEEYGVSVKVFSAKVLLRAGKLLLAGALVAWVVSQVHWYDYTLILDNGEKVTRPGVLSCIGGSKWEFVLFAILSLFDTEILVLQDLPQGTPDARFVVDDQHGGGGHSP